ncbi:IS1182 family transposase [Gemmatimonadetes bacterium T265]|nr:IS1182 family transposase [Gemmatimonadetes bacterium T265]
MLPCCPAPSAPPMARDKHIDASPRVLPVDLARQLLPGTFEHAAHHLLAHAVDLSRFDARFRNDDTGAPAYPPAMLLTVVLCAYAHGIVSSRAIERLCREHVTFIALCGDTAPHVTTIAQFVSTLGPDIAHVFAAVLAVCDRQGLIGRERFAIDGVKLPSHASKRRSGTRANFERQAAKCEAAAAAMLARHRAADPQPVEPDVAAKDTARRERLEHDAQELRTWLAAPPEDRRGPSGGVRQSNRTDADSAKLATGKGVLQGDTGVAAVDAARQSIVEAQAHGTGAEQELLLPVVTALEPVLAPTTVLTADAGYHSEANLRYLAEQHVSALITDNAMRQRDERCATQAQRQGTPDPLYDKTHAVDEPRVFQPSDFTYDAAARTCVCPAGKMLYRSGRDIVTRGYVADHFRGAKGVCGPCPLRAQCLRTPDRTPTRQVACCRGKAAGTPESHTDRMKRRLDTPEGRAQYGRRFATVEPVFGNLRANKRLDRFTLRGRTKVDGPWKLYCLVHNIEKLAHHGYAA